jgi:hypothetical protein
MTPAERRTDAGLWLLHFGATLLGLGVVVAAFAHVVTAASEEETTLVRLLGQAAPWAHRALWVGLVAAAAGAATGATGSGGGARAWAAIAAAALGAAAYLLRTRVDSRALVSLRAESTAASAAVGAIAVGFAAVALHAASVESARGRPEPASSARRLAAHLVVAGAWLVGVFALAARLREARAAEADLDAPGTTLVVAGAGLAALLCACAAWTLRCLAEARAPRPPRAAPTTPGAAEAAA